MGQLIDVRQTPDGLRFRIYSTSSDSYVTQEMTKEEMSNHLLVQRFLGAARNYKDYELPAMEEAEKTGTSDGEKISEASLVDAPWRAEQDPEGGAAEYPTPERLERDKQAVKLLKQIFQL
jgi:hypothetical protein